MTVLMHLGMGLEEHILDLPLLHILIVDDSLPQRLLLLLEVGKDLLIVITTSRHSGGTQYLL